MPCLKAFGERIAARDPGHQTAEIEIRIALDARLNAFAGCQNLRLAEIIVDGKKIHFKTVYRDAEQSLDPASKWIETNGKG